MLGLYDVVGAFDHAARRAYLFSSGLPLAGTAGRERAEARLDDFTRRLESAEKTLAAGPRSGVRAVSTFTPDDYRRAVEKVKDHIRRGDIFQANLSQRWTVELPRGAVPGAMAWALEAALARPAGRIRHGGADGIAAPGGALLQGALLDR